MTPALLERLPDSLLETVKPLLAPGETIEVSLKGLFNEALVCTNRRAMIVKRGLMVGYLFGSSVFQMPYSALTSTQVVFHVLTGYFELSGGGMLAGERSVWSNLPGSSSLLSANCVAITRGRLTRFQQAASYITGKIEEARSGVNRSALF